MTQEDLYILLIQQTLDNDYLHLARMRRRLNTLEEEIHEKEKLIHQKSLAPAHLSTTRDQHSSCM